MIEEAKKTAIENGIGENIFFTGYVSEHRKLQLLKQSRVFLFPSYAEGWSISIAEAMASGLPVVAYDLPIYKEIFDGRLVTVPIGNTKAMSAKVRFLLENPEVSSKMGETNRGFVGRYDWTAVAEGELAAIVGVLTLRGATNRHRSKAS